MIKRNTPFQLTQMELELAQLRLLPHQRILPDTTSQTQHQLILLLRTAVFSMAKLNPWVRLMQISHPHQANQEEILHTLQVNPEEIFPTHQANQREIFHILWINHLLMAGQLPMVMNLLRHLTAQQRNTKNETFSTTEEETIEEGLKSLAHPLQPS